MTQTNTPIFMTQENRNAAPPPSPANPTSAGLCDQRRGRRRRSGGGALLDTAWVPVVATAIKHLAGRSLAQLCQFRSSDKLIDRKGIIDLIKVILNRLWSLLSIHSIHPQIHRNMVAWGLTLSYFGWISADR